jgi:hypothetical protein
MLVCISVVFNTSTATGMEYVRKQEMVAKESYQAAGINYQVKGLIREDNERILSAPFNSFGILRLRSTILLMSSTALNGRTPVVIVVFIVSLR